MAGDKKCGSPIAIFCIPTHFVAALLAIFCILTHFVGIYYLALHRCNAIFYTPALFYMFCLSLIF